MKIPFFPNTGDGTHCFQAVLKMALAHLLPDREFSYDELDLISKKLPGKWTWPTAAFLWMIGEGLKIKLVEEFDYKSFVNRGSVYLIERFGEEVGKAQIENSEIEREREIAKKFVKKAPLEYRIPAIDDIKREIENGAVVIVNLNAAALHGAGGYSGHFVVVSEVGADSIIIQDPGLPPYPDFKVPIGRFESAWSYPSKRDRNMVAISRGCHPRASGDLMGSSGQAGG